MREKAKEYLDEETSYRQVVQQQGKPILYDDRDGSSLPARQDCAVGLAPSTVWRWLSWLGSLGNVMREASALVRQKAPASALHRETWPITVRKYRSEERRQTLQRAAQTLVVELLFRELLEEEMFPNFATAHGWS